MIEFLRRLRQRKLVQWTLAYIAAAFTLIQSIDVVADHFAWPGVSMRYLILASAVGFFVVIIITWYHGERGAQRFSGAELLIIALLLAIGGVTVRYLARNTGPAPALAGASHGATPPAAATTHAAAVPRATPAATPVALAAAPVPSNSIAVLPFENLSSDKENDYFVAGIQNLVLTRLGDIGNLRVSSRTSTLAYKSHPENLRTIAAELGVATILEGSVQKAGKEVLISVQLVDAKTDTHLWSQTYKRTLDDIFGVEGEVAEKIARALGARLDAAQSLRLASLPTTNPAAYDLYLHAENETSGKRAIPLYRQAIAKDPNFALAYARLADAENAMARRGGEGESPRQLYAQAQVDVEHALRLAPNLARAHLVSGGILFFRDGDNAGALKAFNTALALNPNDVDALSSRGVIERAQGHFDVAIESFTQALLREPRNGGFAFSIGLTHMMLRHYVEAKAWMQRVLALNPDSAAAQWGYARAILLEHGDVAGSLAVAGGDTLAMKQHRVDLLLYQRKFRAVIALAESMPDVLPSQQGTKTAILADFYRYAGDHARARKLYAQSLKADRPVLEQVQGTPLAGVWTNVGWDEIGVGNIAAGLAAIAKAEAIMDQLQDATLDAVQRRVNAQAYAFAGRADLAVPSLEKALTARGGGADYSPALLWLDPAWDPIRADPRFQALLAQYAAHKPAVLYDVARSEVSSATQ